MVVRDGDDYLACRYAFITRQIESFQWLRLNNGLSRPEQEQYIDLCLKERELRERLHEAHDPVHRLASH